MLLLRQLKLVVLLLITFVSVVFKKKKNLIGKKKM